MRVLVHGHDVVVCMAIVNGLLVQQIEAYDHRQPQVFTSQLYRDPDAIGVLHSPAVDAARPMLAVMRQAQVRNALLALINPPSPPLDLVSPLVQALGAGADDAQFWPLHEFEVVARVRALRGRMERAAVTDDVEFLGCRYVQASGEVKSPTASVTLTRQEAQVFEAIIGRRGAVASYSEIYAAIYGIHNQFRTSNEPNTDIIKVFVSKMRRKLLTVLDGRDVIETIWGEGFRFVPTGYDPTKLAARKAFLSS